MAKFCMFCGESLPDAAVFCPSCGNKQQTQETETKNEEIIEEEDSDELDLLSQFGYIKPRQPKKAKPPFNPTSKKEETPEPKKEEQEDSSELEILAKTYNKEKSNEETVVKTPVKEEKIKENLGQKISLEIKKEESPKDSLLIPENTKDDKAPEKKDNEEKDVAQPQTQRTTSRRQSVRHTQEQNKNIPFKPTESVKNENAMPIIEDKEEKYELPEDFSIIDNDSDDFCSLEEMLDAGEKMEEERKLKEELEQKKQSQKEKEDIEAIAAKKPQKSSRGFFRKRKETVNVEEEEEFNTQLTSVDGGKSMMEKETLYADEIEDNKRYKETSNDDEEEEQKRKRTGEGRKQIQTNTKQRRKSSRSADINKKIYNIEHDLSDIDPEELEYDGYYENVLPIDHDSLEKKKIDPKIVIAILGGIALFGLAVWLVIFLIGM